jgi:hypothetical protein
MKDTIEMAREAGIKLAWVTTITGSNKMKVLLDFDQLKAFEALVRADEREQAEERITDLFADMETPYLPDITAAVHDIQERS